MYWGLQWWAWAGIGAIFIAVTLLLARVIFRAFERVAELTGALGKAKDDLNEALEMVRNESERAREGLERLRERPEETEPPTANPYAR